MRIELTNGGKRFNREWIFRGANLQFSSGTSYAITGPNGSGKSTLLQVLGGMLELSEGKIEYATGNEPSSAKASAGKQLAIEHSHKHISFCAPYMEVVEEMTLLEFLRFHQQFKPFLSGFDAKAIVGEVGLQSAAGKQIRYYSSGMKQRVKLAQAVFSNASIVLLDEPCSNLDAKGIELYHLLVERHCKDRLVVVCSNDPVEYDFCNAIISIADYKQ